jgi:hypothetical protein
MIDATTIDEIQAAIADRHGGDYIVLIVFCRYRKDRMSLPWRLAANNINFHYSAGADLDIYVPGFSFYGRNEGEQFGHAIEIKNSEPFGYYYPKVLVEAEEFFRREMRGFQLGSSVVAVAVEVNGGAADWRNGAVMNFTDRTAEGAERQMMSIIYGCKSSPGLVQPSVARFQRNHRLNCLVDFLTRNGWSAASAFTGAGALIIDPTSF